MTKFKNGDRVRRNAQYKIDCPKNRLLTAVVTDESYSESDVGVRTSEGENDSWAKKWIEIDTDAKPERKPRPYWVLKVYGEKFLAGLNCANSDVYISSVHNCNAMRFMDRDSARDSMLSLLDDGVFPVGEIKFVKVNPKGAK